MQPDVIKPFFTRFSTLNIILVFCVALAVSMFVPPMLGASQPSLLQGISQSAAIAIMLGIIQLLIVNQGETTEETGSSAPKGVAVNSIDTDGLTRGLNQRGLTVKLLELMALGERYGNNLSIAIIGVDHYGEVVDRYGQEAADNALVAISNELADSLRMPDVLGRWADDQFIAILPETPLEGASHIGERMREAVARAQFDGKRGVVLTSTASIGVTVFRAGDDLQGLLSRATRAMNTAKSQGRDRVITDLAA